MQFAAQSIILQKYTFKFFKEACCYIDPLFFIQNILTLGTSSPKAMAEWILRKEVEEGELV